MIKNLYNEIILNYKIRNSDLDNYEPNIDDFVIYSKFRPELFYVIHYSCQNLFDENEGLSPRITSIVIRHMSTRHIESFAIHAIAEELRIYRNQIHRKMDEIERELLIRYSEFIDSRLDSFWIHWNMRSLTYGFEHIEHRYRALCEKKMSRIPIVNRFNLNDYLAKQHGRKYTANPKMYSLMDLNGERHQHILTGNQEVNAFKKQKFLKIHNSTVCKTGFFVFVLDRLYTRKLVTNSIDIGQRFDKWLDSRSAKILLLFCTLISSLFAIYCVF